MHHGQRGTIVSFLDDIKSRITARTSQMGYGNDQYGDEEGYADGYYDESDASYDEQGYGASDSYGYEPQESSHGVLGQTHRGEAVSVAV